MSYNIISIQESETPISIATKYIIKNLGMNVRPGKYKYDHFKQEHIIQLNAIIPNDISPIKKSTKYVYYIFENIGNIFINKDQKITSTSSDEIEKNLQKKFRKIHYKIEDIIKEYGKNEWGRLTYVKWYLNPLFSIINKMLINQELFLSDLIKQDYWKYTKPFLMNKLFMIDKYNQNKIIPSNYLNALIDKYDNAIEISELTIGIIINHSTNYLINKLNIYNFMPYIDLSKIYYSDALQYGENIEISYKDFIKKYQRIAKSTISFKRDINLHLITSELIHAGLLNKNPIQNSISGVDELFNSIMKFRSDILENRNIIIEG